MSTTNDKSNALVILTEFERRLATCRTVSEVKTMRDEAEAFRHYARVAGMGVQAQNRCAQARHLAERKLGELFAALPRAPGPGRGKRVAANDKSFLKTLAAAGFVYNQVRWWQRMAQVPETEFRRELERYCQPQLLTEEQVARRKHHEREGVEARYRAQRERPQYFPEIAQLSEEQLAERITRESEADWEGDGPYPFRELTPDVVRMFVDEYIQKDRVASAERWRQDHPDEAAQDDAELLDVELRSRQDAENAASEAQGHAPVSWLMDQLEGAMTETRDLLLELQKRTPAYPEIREVDVREMLTLADQLLALRNRTNQRRWASLGSRRDAGLMKFAASAAGG